MYLFRCDTYYHLMLSAIVIEKKNIKKKSVIVFKIDNNSFNDELLTTIQRMKDIGFNIHLIIQETRSIVALIHDFADIRNIRNKIPKNEKIVLVNFRWNMNSIYLNSLIYFLKSDEIIFIEDGALCYVNNTGEGVKKLLKQITGLSRDFNREKKIKAIYVSDTAKYQSLQGDKLKDLVSLIGNEPDEHTKNDLKYIFFGDKSVIDGSSTAEDKVILFTQPLSEDGYISEERKKEIYSDMINYYSQYGSVYIKVHPRDLMTYNIPNCIVLGKDWPSEMLTYMDVKFDYAVGICTSAISGCNAEKKMNINDNFLYDKKLQLIPF